MVQDISYTTSNPGLGLSRDFPARRAQDIRKHNRTNGVYWIQPSGYSPMQVYCDMETDQGGWMCVFTCFPRDTSCYNTAAVGGIPTPFDTVMNKFEDGIIKAMLNDGDRITRTFWTHRSVEFTSIFADGGIAGGTRSVQWNRFTTPNEWFSDATSSGSTFERSWGNPFRSGGAWSGPFTSGSTSGCSGAVGGWSNYYEQSCTQSWYAGCEGGPACNHRCAGAVQDRAERLVIWVR
jgi:hypothetical protein